MAVRAAIVAIGVAIGVAVGVGPVRADDPPGELLPPPTVAGDGWPRTALQPGPLPDRPPLLSPPVGPARPADPGPLLPGGGRVTLPSSGRQTISIGQRYDRRPSYVLTPLPDGSQRWVWVNGVVVNVVYQGGPGGATQEVEFATDTAVIWVKGAGAQDLAAGGLDTGPPAGPGGKPRTQVELYLAGDVVIRSLSPGGPAGRPVEQVVRADEIYYEVNANRAIALDADLEVRGDGLDDPVHLRGREVWRLGRNEWRAFDALTYASKRPADPNLTVAAAEAVFTQQRVVRRNVFGLPYRRLDGGPDEGFERTLTTYQATVRVADVPVFYSPKTVTDLSEPFGPLTNLGFGNDGIFGFQVYTTFDAYRLIGVRPPAGHRWLANADYLSDRGPGFGTLYSYTGPDAFGLGGPAAGFVKGYAIYDRGDDRLGAFRGPEPLRPFDYRQAVKSGLAVGPAPGWADDYWRDRLQWRHNQDLYDGGDEWARVMAQLERLSDKNFLEQYYKQEFDAGPNQESFLFLHAARGDLWASALVQANVQRNWVTETEWLPRVDAASAGRTFFDDMLVYSGRASAGYARLMPAEVPPRPVLATDQPVEGGRFDLAQRVDLPVDAGPFRVTPFGLVELTYYSNAVGPRPGPVGPLPGANDLGPVPGPDLFGPAGDRGRFLGGGGVSVSTTLSRLYPDVRSDVLNVRGLNHKVTAEGRYYASYADTPYYLLPQYDRVFDDALDQGYRDTRPAQVRLLTQTAGGRTVPTAAGRALATSPLFDPQQYAIRRLVDTHPDTVQGIRRVDLGVRQRVQTKRGFAGAEHTVDWMTLDTSAAFFPDPADNYGRPWAFLEYLYQWQVGDRASVTSSGWADPIDFGARYFTVGVNFNRPDGTNFYLSYRHTDPINSRAVTASLGYQLSGKYAVSAGAAYDFGFNQALTNSFRVTRTGTDLTAVFGVTYNALLNNVGVQFGLVPNAAAAFAGTGLAGNGGAGGLGLPGGR